MKTIARTACTILLAFTAVGCSNLEYGWRQELEMLRDLDKTIDSASRNRNRPYWASYRYGWNQEVDHFPDLLDCVDRGIRADWKQVTNR